MWPEQGSKREGQGTCSPLRLPNPEVACAVGLCLFARELSGVQAPVGSAKLSTATQPTWVPTESQERGSIIKEVVCAGARAGETARVKQPWLTPGSRWIGTGLGQKWLNSNMLGSWSVCHSDRHKKGRQLGDPQTAWLQD